MNDSGKSNATKRQTKQHIYTSRCFLAPYMPRYVICSKEIVRTKAGCKSASYKDKQDAPPRLLHLGCSDHCPGALQHQTYLRSQPEAQAIVSIEPRPLRSSKTSTPDKTSARALYTPVTIPKLRQSQYLTFRVTIRNLITPS